MGGVMLALALAAINQTMVSTAMPRIVASLGGMHLYSWVFTAYMLAATVLVPICGKLSDLFGRRPLILAGIGVFTLGAFLSGFAQTMEQLIVFRAVQGLGASAMMPVSFAVVADLYSPAERGKSQGAIGAVFGVASLIGPLAGGWITDHWSWHWTFWVNVPLGLATLAYAGATLPRALRGSQDVSIDYLGAALLVGASTPLLLLSSFAGNNFPWASWQTAALAGTGLSLGIAFYFCELKARNPILPPALFRNPIFSAAAAASLFIGVIMFGNTMFVPLFVQGVIGTSATAAGLIMTPMMLSNVAGSMLSGYLASHWGRYRGLVIGGVVLMVVGEFLLTTMSTATTNGLALIYVVVVGIGLGMTMPLFILAVQNAVPPQQIGSVTSLIQFFRTMGGTLGVAGLGAVLSHHTTVELQARFGDKPAAELPGPQALLAPGAAAQFPLETLDAIRDALAHGLHNVFVFGVGASVVALVVSFLLRDIPLRKSPHPPLQEATEELAAEGLPGMVLRPEDEPDLLGRRE